MLFKDLKIGNRFRFTHEDKIYTKSSSYSCERFLEERSVFGETVIISASDNEIEDSELIVKNSTSNLRLD